MRELVTAEILAVGSELLTPHRTDTNSLYLTARLNEAGIDVRAKAIVGDDPADLRALFVQALSRADVVVLTGGLGPTADDLTRETVAAALDLPLDEDADILGSIQARFASRGMAMPAINAKQAHVPRGATVLANTKGTAPGLWIDTGGKVVVLLPGPPRELQTMVDALVMPRIRERTGGRNLVRRVLKMTGKPESAVEEVAEPIYRGMTSWPIPVQTTILAAPGQIELHLSARGADHPALERALDDAVTALTGGLGDIVYSTDARSLPEVVGHLLRDRHLRIAVAESCTGGLVLGRLTDVPGSSAWVVGGVMAYANEIKIEQLGVPAHVLAEQGAVSEPVAMAMAVGVRGRLHADVGLSVTGIAGPSGGTAEKPVGTVAIAVSRRGRGETVRTFRFVGDRQMVRHQAVQAALDMVRRCCER